MMRVAVKRFLRVHPRIRDNYRRRQATLLYYTTLLIFFFSITQWVIVHFIGSEAEKRQIWLFAGFAILQIPTYFLIRAGYTRLVGVLLLGLGAGLSAFFALTLAGIHDAAILIFFVIMLGSAILVGWQALIGFTIFGIGAVWWLAWLQTTGRLVPILSEPFNIARDFMIVFVLMFLVVYYFIDALSSAIKDTNREMTERKVIEEELRKQAVTDFLTGIYNRRHFFYLMNLEFLKANRYKRNLAVMIMDIDHFKSINDTYGHDFGDKVLIKFTEAIRLNIREIDVFARYGGEEFIILMPETDCAEANNSAERLRIVIEQTPFIVGDKTINLTFSAGISGKSCDEDISSFDLIISQADEGLYEAKQAGRNRVACKHKYE